MSGVNVAFHVKFFHRVIKLELWLEKSGLMQISGLMVHQLTEKMDSSLKYMTANWIYILFATFFIKSVCRHVHYFLITIIIVNKAPLIEPGASVPTQIHSFGNFQGFMCIKASEIRMFLCGCDKKINI